MMQNNSIKTKSVFISWTKENGRTSDLATELNLTPKFVYFDGNIIIRYIKSFIFTWREIRASKGNSVVMLPPTPLLICAILAAGRHRNKLVFDLHTGFFYDPKWSWATLPSLFLLRGCTAIVTNGNLEAVAAKAGVNTIQLHDFLVNSRTKPVSARTKHQVVCPVSYSNDEPIGALLEAAANMPDVEWVLTGRAPDSLKAVAPKNVTFPGFVADEQYLELIRNSSVVVALTNRRDTMQRAAYEALMLGTVVVTSDFQVLREFFEDSALYVPLGEANLRSVVAHAISEREVLLSNGDRVILERIEEQQETLAALRNLINNR